MENVDNLRSLFFEIIYLFSTRKKYTNLKKYKN